MTGTDQTLISAFLLKLTSLKLVLIVSLVYLGGNVLVKHKSNFHFDLILFLYLLGVWGSRVLFNYLEPSNRLPLQGYSDLPFYVYYRSFFLLPICLLVLILIWKDRFEWNIGKFGRLGTRTRIFKAGSPKRSWRQVLWIYTFLIVIPSLIAFQAGMNFEHLKSLNYYALIPAILVMSVFNGLSEELIFRGFLLTVFVKQFGAKAGIALQGVLFGFLHWGSSPDLISGLPMAVFLAFIGVMAGKSVHETKGMGWAIIAHTLADFAIFSTAFIRI